MTWALVTHAMRYTSGGHLFRWRVVGGPLHLAACRCWRTAP
jgi:hypothetical protein